MQCLKLLLVTIYDYNIRGANYMKKYKLLTAFLTLAFTLTFLGCDSSSPKNDANQTGTLNIFLTNAPAEFEAIYITLDSLSIHTSSSASIDSNDTNESGWKVVAQPHTTFNVLQLSSDTPTKVGQLQLAIGKYTGIKGIVGKISDNGPTIVEGYDSHPYANYVVLRGSAVSELEIPSYTLKINQNFNIVKNGNINMLIDFDTKKSIKQTGNGTYKLTPVIKVTTIF